MPAKERKKVIPARRITYYARLCASHNRLEKLRYAVRDEFLKMLYDGYVPATTGPYVLDHSFQNRVNSKEWSWKMVAMELAVKYFMSIKEEDAVGEAMRFIVDQELKAPRKAIDVLSAKPNPLLWDEFLKVAQL